MERILVSLLVLLTHSLALPLSSSLAARDPSITTVYQFPEPDHWFENLAVRSNGQIVATELTEPKLWLINPSNSSRSIDGSSETDVHLVHEFPDYLGLLGIAEYQPDVFAIIAGNFSIANGYQSTPGTYAIWSVNFTSGAPTIEKIVDIPEANFLNGMAYLESDHSLLLGDAGLGLVWKLDLKTSLYAIAIEDPLMAKVTPDAPDGINGLKVYGNELWFTRGYDALVAKTEISWNGTALDAAQIVGRGLNSTWTMDDLVVNSLGDAYVAIPFQNSIARYGGPGTQPVVVAGNIDSTEIAEPTSLAFARTREGVVNEKVLYVATGGAIADPIDGITTVGGQIVRIELCS